MPLLNYYGKYDHLVPPEACELLTSRVGSKDVEDICLDTGHIGIYVSSKCQKEFAPRIARWLKERDEDIKKHKTKTATPKKRALKKTPKKATSSLKRKKDT
jgi:polyhydroxyalkanoate synthase